MQWGEGIPTSLTTVMNRLLAILDFVLLDPALLMMMLSCVLLVKIWMAISTLNLLLPRNLANVRLL